MSSQQRCLECKGKKRKPCGEEMTRQATWQAWKCKYCRSERTSGVQPYWQKQICMNMIKCKECQGTGHKSYIKAT